MQRAPRVCNFIGCPNLVHDETRRRCDDHYVPWPNSHARATVNRNPTNQHSRLRSRVFGAAGWRCQIHYPDICTRRAKVLDRVDNLKGYTDANCQAACQACSDRKTSREGHRAKGDSV